MTCFNDSISDPAAFGVAKDIAAGAAPNLPLTRAAMRECCAPNEIQFAEDDCVVWCELSEEFMETTEKASGNVATELFSCLKMKNPNIASEIVITTGQSGKSVSALSAKPPTLATLGVVALLIFGSFNYFI